MPDSTKTITAIEQMKQHNCWVCWRYNDEGKKIPKDPKETNKNARSNDPSTWASYDKAVAEQHRFDGIGFVFHPTENGFAGVDLDNCIVDGQVEQWAVDIIERLDSYTEISPSGNGVKIFVNAKGLPRLKGINQPYHTGKIEIYNSGRYFTVTGQHLGGAGQ